MVEAIMEYTFRLLVLGYVVLSVFGVIVYRAATHK